MKIKQLASIFLTLATFSLSAQTTRVSLSHNVTVNIEGSYPQNYKPTWQYINNKGPVTMTITNYLMTRGNVVQDPTSIGFTEVDNKMVLQFAQRAGYCLADLDIPGGTITLSDAPATFSLVNWRSERGGPCGTGNPNLRTYEGKVSLSANKNGDLTMDLQVDIFSAPDRKNEVHHTWSYVANRVVLANQLPPAKAALVAADDEAKRLAQIEAEKKQAAYEKRKAIFDKAYSDMYIKIDAKAKPLMDRTKLVYKGYALKKAIEMKELVPEIRPCAKNYGTGDRREEIRDLLRLDIKLIQASESMDFDPKKLEPHERDEAFARVYLYTRGYNQFIVRLAARYAVCDVETVDDMINQELHATKLIDEDEYNTMIKYLEKKN